MAGGVQGHGKVDKAEEEAIALAVRRSQISYTAVVVEETMLLGFRNCIPGEKVKEGQLASIIARSVSLALV